MTVREQFDNTLAFLPFLRSDEEGNVRFDVGVTDKLSTYYVTVFAHSTDMRNAVLGREMVVSLPVKVSATVPRFLYEGDRYCLRASVSNSSDRELSGDMLLYVYGSEDYGHSEPFMVRSVPVTAGAGSASSAEFAVDVPQGVDTLGFKVVYMAEIDGITVSDAMFVTDNGIPCYVNVDWFTPDGLGSWGDGRMIIIGTKGYIELRKYIDVAAENTPDHVILVDDKAEYHYKVNGKVGYPFFSAMILDCINGTETAIKIRRLRHRVMTATTAGTEMTTKILTEATSPLPYSSAV